MLGLCAQSCTIEEGVSMDAILKLRRFHGHEWKLKFVRSNNNKYYLHEIVRDQKLIKFLFHKVSKDAHFKTLKAKQHI